FDEQSLNLLTWSDDEIHEAGWHVPGVMIRFKETAENRIRTTALDELGAEVTFDGPPVVEQFIEPERQVRGHFIALIYRCRLISGPVESLRFKSGQPERGQWAWHARYPE